MHTKQEILEFMSQKTYMIISTINRSGEPESAVVGFGQTKNFELIFGTVINSRKAQNILSNGSVSAVVGSDMLGTVQYQGNARMLSGGDLDTYTEFYFRKTPEARRHKDNPDERYFIISPKWLRYTDTQVHPWHITEFQF